MGVKIEFLSVWNRNFDTIDARFYCLEIDDRPVLPIYLPFYNEIYTRTYVSSHTFRTRGRIYLQLPLESVNPVFQRISTVYIDIWLRLYSPRAVNHYSVAAALFFCIPSFSSSPRVAPSPTLQRRVASQLHEETDAWRRRCQTWNRACAACAARAIWKLSRRSRVSSIETIERDMPIKLHLFSLGKKCTTIY